MPIRLHLAQELPRLSAVRGAEQGFDTAAFHIAYAQDVTRYGAAEAPEIQLATVIAGMICRGPGHASVAGPQESVRIGSPPVHVVNEVNSSESGRIYYCQCSPVLATDVRR